MTRAIISVLAAVFSMSGSVWAQSEQGDTAVQPVTTEDVKQFLDPALMINRFDYSFTANLLGSSSKLYANEIRPFWAMNSRNALWAELPIRTLSVPESEVSSGMGDVALGWGTLIHENLGRRFTTSALTFEALAPTGDPDRLTGLGTWILAPGGGLAFNPTDVFPVYIVGRYLHSLESLGGNDRADEISQRPELRVRSVELTIQTVHILPKGFFVSAVPSVVFNLAQDFNLFSLGVGAGRALNRNFALSGAYLHHVAGRETFNQAVTVKLRFVFGTRQDR